MFQGGVWQYKISWHPPPSSGEVSAGVLISSLAASSSTSTSANLDISFWTNSDTSSDIVTSQHPLELYVSVNRADTSAPILRAKVIVSVKVMMENTTLVSLPPFTLNDNGNGDPDMLANDGIYSRYMTNYPTAGRYIFTVTVSDNDGQAVAVVESDKSNTTRRCCGSFLDFADSELTPTGLFNQVLSPPAVNLIQVPPADAADRMPPSKIGNLRIKVLAESTSLLASWTAPGDDFDTGYVRGYQFVYSSSMSELLDHTLEPRVLVSLRRADKAGMDTSFQFQFNFFEEELYVGLRGLDEANNTGKVSNIVPVFMPNLAIESAVSPTIKDGRSAVVGISADDDNDWTMIGALCGAILLLGLFLLLGIIYFLRVAKPKKPASLPVHVGGVGGSGVGGREDNTDNSSCGSDNSKNTSSHRLMPDITTVAGTLPIFQAPPSTLPDSTPTYWSATQLLTEHEQRALNLSYSAIHGPMETIREEYIGYPEEFPADSSRLSAGAGAGTPDPGITNLGYSRHSNNNNHGTPVHGIFGKNSDGSVRSGSYRLERPTLPPEDPYLVDRASAASSSNPSESVISVGSNLYRSMGGTDLPAELMAAAAAESAEPVSYSDSAEPVRYSTAVQTTAPSTTASLRLNRSRNVSLV